MQTHPHLAKISFLYTNRSTNISLIFPAPITLSPLFDIISVSAKIEHVCDVRRIYPPNKCSVSFRKLCRQHEAELQKKKIWWIEICSPCVRLHNLIYYCCDFQWRRRLFTNRQLMYIENDARDWQKRSEMSKLPGSGKKKRQQQKYRREENLLCMYTRINSIIRLCRK